MFNQELVGANLGSLISGADVAPALRDLLRQRHIEDSLRLVATVAAEQAASIDTDSNVTLRDHQLALVIRFLLEDESENQERTDALSRRELAVCCEMATSVISSTDKAYGVPVPDDGWSLMHRIAYQQFPDQEEHGYVPRSLVLYRQIAPNLQDASGFHFEKEFEDAYGLSIDEAWMIGYSLYRWCLENPGVSFDGSDLARLIEVDGDAERKAKNFLSVMSCDYASYRTLLGVPSGQHPHFEPYNLNPFRKLPILELPDGQYLVPIPGYLLRRITHGLYYDLIELNRTGFVSLVALAFHAYAGNLLKASHPDGSLVAKAEQWMVSASDTAVVINCITRPFGALSRSTGDREHLREDLTRRGGVVDYVIQLQELMSGGDTGKGLRSTLGGEKVIGLVVALEDFYLANGPHIRSVVDEELEERGKPRTDSSIQFAHVSGLESLCALASAIDTGLPDLLRKKVDTAAFDEMELDTYAHYLASTYRDGQLEDLIPAILKETASEYLGDNKP